MKITDAIFEQFKCNPAISADRIREFESVSGVRLREDYVAFLMQSNGGEGFIGEGYAMLWRLEELVEMNRGYNVASFAPGLCLFGSDGGGEAFAFDRRFDAQPIVRVPFIPLAISEAVVIGKDFDQFLGWLSTLAT